MSLIIAGLLPMIVLTLLSIVFGADFISLSLDTLVGNEPLINETWSGFTTEGLASFGIDEFTGAILILVTIMGISTLLGIRILGSGLSDTSVRLITILVSYVSVWLLLSIISAPLIFDIPIFGAIIYATLTLMYVIGVMRLISEGG